MLRRTSAAVVFGLTAALTACLVELLLQLALVWGAPEVLADPIHYADPLSDDWYWQHVAQRQGAPEKDQVQLHGRWGWLPPRARLGLDQSFYPDASASGRAVRLYGDSFVAGTSADESRVATILQARLGEAWQVQDRSVGGFGLGQIVLRVEDDSADWSPDEVVVIGVMTTDIDRAVLRWRPWPKPRVRLQNDDVVFERSHLGRAVPSPETRLLLWSRARRWMQGRLDHRRGLPHAENRTSEKRELATRLLRRLRTTCRQQQARCLLVPFLRREDVQRPAGWREQVLLEKSVGLETLHPRGWISEPFGAMFGEDGHPTRRQNEAVAEQMAAWVGGLNLR